MHQGTKRFNKSLRPLFPKAQGRARPDLQPTPPLVWPGGAARATHSTQQALVASGARTSARDVCSVTFRSRSATWRRGNEKAHRETVKLRSARGLSVVEGAAGASPASLTRVRSMRWPCTRKARRRA